MKHVNKLIAAAGLAFALHSHPSAAAVNCLAIGAQACLNALDALVNSQSFVEAWAAGAYNLYQTRNCSGLPSPTATYTFYGRNTNKAGQMVDLVLPSVSCNECEVLRQISGQVDQGYLGVCASSADDTWEFTGHFCLEPAPQGSLVQRTGLSLYDAANLFVECGFGYNGNYKITSSACSPIHGCLQ